VGGKPGEMENLVKHKYIWLDFIRAIAAIEVFLGHLRGILFKGYSSGSTGIIKTIFYFFTGFGHEAVVIFFVLSGYLITDAIFRAKDRNGFSFLNYGLDRLIRLWVVILPGLLLTWVLDKTGLHYFASSPAYLGTIEYMGNINVLSHLSWTNFIGNVFFLQTILVETFGSNSPLWSLSNEFWYYTIFPLILFLCWKGKIWKKGIVFCILISVIIFIGTQISLYFLIWLTGAALVYLKKSLPAPSGMVKNLILAVGLGTLGIVFYKLRIGGNLDFKEDFLSALPIVVLCYWGIYADMKFELPKKVISFFSGMSYSLYVIHLPLCIFLCSAFNAIQKDWTLKNFGFYSLIVSMVMGFTVLFWFCFEFRYLQLRTYARHKLL
jgi:peptidoglycan/LPS O-acetylase OafA/YrhL